MSAQPTLLLEGATRSPVTAHLHCDLRKQDLLLIERVWSEHRAMLRARLGRAGVPPRQWPQSLHWDWSHKAVDLQLLAAAACGVECGDAWQAAMMTKTQPHTTRLAPDCGKPLVYIDFLEVAPWNWRLESIGQEPRYRSAGTVLLRQAVVQSLQEGFHGRVGLHALPQAEAFYGGHGLLCLDRDAAREGLAYFEFSRAAAQAFLDGRIA